jgi:hypothetical protein
MLSHANVLTSAMGSLADRVISTHPRFLHDVPHRGLRVGHGGERVRKALPGVGFVQAFGQTELSPVATWLGRAEHENADRPDLLRSAGRAAMHAEGPHRRRRGPPGAPRDAGRDRRARRPRHAGLLEPARGDGRGAPWRLVPHRRRRADGRRRLPLRARPAQGHDRERRRERVLRRGGERRRVPSGGGLVRRDRAPRRGLGRDRARCRRAGARRIGRSSSSTRCRSARPARS